MLPNLSWEAGHRLLFEEKENLPFLKVMFVRYRFLINYANKDVTYLDFLKRTRLDVSAHKSFTAQECH